MKQQQIGGGFKKVLYTLNAVRKIGTVRVSKALKSKNACKACAFGMGGQRGGMTNEQNEFPSVCNKSVQAQSTDIQQAIPNEIFDHTLVDLKELSARELEHLGRLNTPLYKAKNENKYRPIGWDEAIDIAANKLTKTDPDRSFFYASGRSSNEAGFLFQLFARAYGTNNVSNCSYYCHQATSVALDSTIGTGTSTVELADLDGCDLIFVIGANPSSNHPRYIHKLKACRERGGKVIIINPAKEPGLIKFAVPKSPTSLLKGGSDIASHYLQPRIGSDIAVFKGIAKVILDMGAHNIDFIKKYCIGFATFKASIEETTWQEIETMSGLSQVEITDVAKAYASSKSAVFSWGMGMTHHLHGVENIEEIANLALLRGMIGRPHAGLLPLRGHSNVQGIGTIGVKPVLATDVLSQMEKEFDVTFSNKKGMDTMSGLQAAYRGDIDAAVILGGNLYAASPNTPWAIDALDKIDFKLFLTTTLNSGHINGLNQSESVILPVTARDEEWQTTTQESMFNYVRMSDGGINRLDNVRPEVTILSNLASKVLPNYPIDFSVFNQHKEIRQAIANTVPGMEDLATIDIAKQEFHVRERLIHKPVFKTPDGKAHFQVNTQQNDKVNIDYPLTLTTIRSEGQFNSIIYEERDSYRGTDTRWSVLMNSSDMENAGLREGDTTTLTSPYGEMRDLKVFPFSLPEGNIMAYYPEANALTGTSVDSRSLTPSFKATPVKLSIN